MLPEGSLKGKVAIITGGATGLGEAMAMEYARLGANIVIASRKQEKLDEAKKEIEIYGTKVKTIQMDVREPDQVEKMVSETVAAFGKIDILVNNAAGNFLVKAIDMSTNAWNTVINIVLNGTWYCSQSVAKQMIAQDTPGTILNVGATYAWTGGPLTAHSAAAKAGVDALTKTLAVEWAPHNIRVNMITPGPTEDTGAVSQLWASPEQEEQILDNIPTHRLSTRQEVANLASYLVSDYASYVTGANHVIDGGGWLNKGRYKDDLKKNPY
ncbi:2,4-dienoyl-CoA reductase [Salicibibacter halophilus]|uniref:2,4-dienoyl-CoA reductase n=1 Tax=Salicibibacter halophilus TaxID=2502791 RepID=A0A514LMD6_9BACI|nr:2,4-dienoyl-CoA reductase [Salicibibacter halophilus]QDI92973.1 2,4-dienoyl-CoA reductase [Salicibibacter halophilus]